jgi:hypothetical protein
MTTLKEIHSTLNYLANVKYEDSPTANRVLTNALNDVNGLIECGLKEEENFNIIKNVISDLFKGHRAKARIAYWQNGQKNFFTHINETAAWDEAIDYIDSL